MNIDLDEYIVPHSKQTIPELLGYLESDEKNIAAFNFQNAFFCLQLPDDTNRKYDLRVLKKTLRTQAYNPPRKRSKYICVTKNIGRVALLLHFDKVLSLSKFALLKCKIYSCVLEPHSSDSPGH